MSYQQAVEFLGKYTQVVELHDAAGARVAVCPAWQGRVMTSSCDGGSGLSFGFINEPYVREGKVNPHFNNYGAEERMWLSPEGGQFSLWFQPGAPQDLAHWYTPPAFNEGAWAVAPGPNATSVRMNHEMRLGNASGSRFHLDVSRDVNLLAAADFARLFGPTAAAPLGQPGVKMVAYETVNRIENRGTPLSPAGGLVSIWILGMLNCGPQTVILVPYRPGSEAELGPVVKSDYFGSVPAERLKVTPEAILFRADGNYRAKIGTSQRRARNVLGSIDYEHGVLTLVQFSMPENPVEHAYLNNMWQVPQAQPFVGDVANSYNDGPVAPGKPGLGPFYEIESLSPAQALATGQSLAHTHRTIHIQGPQSVLADLARQVLGVDLERVRHTMLGQ